MKLLLLEDDKTECKKFKDLATSKPEIEFVAITDSTKEAIQTVRRQMPDGIILDLELNNGTGSGFEFIQELRKMKLSVIPKVVVTTNVCSDSVYEYLHKNKVDFIFYKGQNNYSQENVINTLLLLKDFNNNDNSIVEIQYDEENKEEIERMLSDMINKELDLIGVGTHLVGRAYLHDSILYLLQIQGTENQIPTVKYLSAQYKKSASTISRDMQNALISAWRISPPDELEKIYTARINIESGVPTPNEFIYFYVDKIRKML